MFLHCNVDVKKKEGNMYRYLHESDLQQELFLIFNFLCRISSTW